MNENETKKEFKGKELFESMEGFYYFASQLTDYPEEERLGIAFGLLWHIENGYMV